MIDLSGIGQADNSKASPLFHTLVRRQLAIGDSGVKAAQYLTSDTPGYNHFASHRAGSKPRCMRAYNHELMYISL